MDVVEPDEANETMEDLTDAQLEEVAGGREISKHVHDCGTSGSG